MARKRTTYTDEFKHNIIQMYNNGKPSGELITEYQLSSSTLYKWINENNKTGSFKTKDNRSLDEQKLIDLQKENKQLKMENDILKQAALQLGKK